MTHIQGLFMAELRSSVGKIEHLYWRKPALKLDEAAAIYEPPAYRSKLYADQVYGADQAENLNVREIGAIS
jgi:hypothetical protein